jgi:hypothetical protein
MEFFWSADLLIEKAAVRLQGHPGWCTLRCTKENHNRLACLGDIEVPSEVSRAAHCWTAQAGSRSTVAHGHARLRSRPGCAGRCHIGAHAAPTTCADHFLEEVLRLRPHQRASASATTDRPSHRAAPDQKSNAQAWRPRGPPAWDGGRRECARAAWHRTRA